MRIIDIVKYIIAGGRPRYRPRAPDPEEEPQIAPGVSQDDGNFILSAMGRCKFADREFYGEGCQAAYERRASRMGVTVPKAEAVTVPAAASKAEKREAAKHEKLKRAIAKKLAALEKDQARLRAL